MYSRDYLDDYDPSSTYSDAFSTTGRTVAERRKNDWKYANRRKNVLNNYGIESNKPLHYYSKNVLKHKNFKIDRILHNERQIDNFENQLKELFDEE